MEPFSFFSVTGWGIDLDYCDSECVASGYHVGYLYLAHFYFAIVSPW